MACISKVVFLEEVKIPKRKLILQIFILYKDFIYPNNKQIGSEQGAIYACKLLSVGWIDDWMKVDVLQYLKETENV